MASLLVAEGRTSDSRHHPQSASDGTYTYTGWVSTTGQIGVTQVNNTTGAIQHHNVTADGFDQDSHSSAAVLPLSTGGLAVIYEEHNGSGHFVSVCSDVSDFTNAANWATIQVTGDTAVTSYVEAYELLGYVYFFYRSGTTGSLHTLTMRRCSVAAGLTTLGNWSGPLAVLSGGFDDAYWDSCQGDVDRIDFVVGTHDSDPTDLYHFYMIADGGTEAWHKSDDTVLTRPFNLTTASLVASGFWSVRAMARDASDGRIHVAARNMSLTDSDQTFFAFDPGTDTWAAGVNLITALSTGKLAQALDFDPLDINRLYVQDVDNKQLIEASYNGSTWSIHRVLHTYTEGDASIWVPTNRHTDLGVFYKVGTWTNFSTYDFDIFAAPMDGYSLPGGGESGYTYFQKLTIPAAQKVGGALGTFPAMITHASLGIHTDILDSASSLLQADGGNVRLFADEARTQRLPVHVAFIRKNADPALGRMQIHTGLTDNDGGSPTDIWLALGDPSETAQPSKDSTFGSEAALANPALVTLDGGSTEAAFGYVLRDHSDGVAVVSGALQQGAGPWGGDIKDPGVRRFNDTIVGHLTDNFMFSSWFYTDADSGILGGIRNSSVIGWALQVQSTGELQFADSSGTTHTNLGSLISLNAWTQIDIIVIGSEARVRVNGAHHATLTGLPAVTNRVGVPFRFGARGGTSEERTGFDFTGALQYGELRTVASFAEAEALSANRFSNFNDPGTFWTAGPLEEIPAGTVPADPTNLQLTVDSDTQISATWTDNATNETSYEVEIYSDAGYSALVDSASLSVDSVSHQFTGLTAETQYWVKIYPTNATGDATNPLTGTATTDAAPAPGLDISFDFYGSRRAEDLDGYVSYPTAEGDIDYGWSSTFQVNQAASTSNPTGDVRLDGRASTSTAGRTFRVDVPNGDYNIEGFFGPVGYTGSFGANQFEIYDGDPAASGILLGTGSVADGSLQIMDAAGNLYANNTDAILTGHQALAATITNGAIYFKPGATKAIQANWIRVSDAGGGGAIPTTPPTLSAATNIVSDGADIPFTLPGDATSVDFVVGEDANFEATKTTTQGYTGSSPFTITGEATETLIRVEAYARNETGAETTGDSITFTTAAAGTIPDAPTIGTTSGITHNSAVLNWADNSGNETSFEWEVHGDSGFTSLADSGSTAANAVSDSATGLSASTNYWPRVRAINAEGSSAWSEGISFTTEVTPAEPSLDEAFDMGGTVRPEDNDGDLVYPQGAGSTTYGWSSLSGVNPRTAADNASGDLRLNAMRTTSDATRHFRVDVPNGDYAIEAFFGEEGFVSGQYGSHSFEIWDGEPDAGGSILLNSGSQGATSRFMDAAGNTHPTIDGPGFLLSHRPVFATITNGGIYVRPGIYGLKFNWLRVVEDIGQYDVVPDSAPTPGTSTQETFNRATINWTNNSTNADETEIQVQTAGGDWSNLLYTEIVPGSVTSKNVRFFSPSTNYEYRLRDLNEFGAGSWSTTGTFTTTAAPAADYTIITANLPAAFTTLTNSYGEAFPVQLAFTDGTIVGLYTTTPANPAYKGLFIKGIPPSPGTGKTNGGTYELVTVDIDGIIYQGRVGRGGLTPIENTEAITPSMARLKAAIDRGDIAPYDEDLSMNHPLTISDLIERNDFQEAWGPWLQPTPGSVGSQDDMFRGHDASPGEGVSSRGPYSENDAKMIRHAWKGNQAGWDGGIETIRVQAQAAMMLPFMFIWSHNHHVVRDPGKMFSGDNKYVTTGSGSAGWDTYDITTLSVTIPNDYTAEDLAILGYTAGDMGTQVDLDRDHAHWFNHGMVYAFATEHPMYLLMQQGMLGVMMGWDWQGALDESTGNTYGSYQAGIVWERGTFNQWWQVFNAKKASARITDSNDELFWSPARMAEIETEMKAHYEGWIASFYTEAASPASTQVNKGWNAFHHSVDSGGISPFMQTAYGFDPAYMWAIDGWPILLERLASHHIVKMYHGKGVAAYNARTTDGNTAMPVDNGGLYVPTVSTIGDLPYDSSITLGQWWEDWGAAEGKSRTNYDGYGYHYLHTSWLILKRAKQLMDAGYISPTNYEMSYLDVALPEIETRIDTSATVIEAFTIKHAGALYTTLPGEEPAPSFDAAKGSFALAGHDATVGITALLSLSAGSYSLTGHEASLSDPFAPEALVPDAVLSSSNLSVVLSDLQVQDANWAASIDNAAATDLIVSFPTPSANPVTGANLQTIIVEARKSASGGSDATMTISVRESGGADLVTSGLITVTSLTGSLHEFTFDAALLSDPTGAGLEVHLIGQQPTGSPTNRRTVDFGFVEWVLYAPLVGIAAEAGSYAILGREATLAASLGFEVGKGSFALAGRAASAPLSAPLGLSAGVYDLIGRETSLAALLGLSLEAGSFSLSGYPATFTVLATYPLAAEAGSFSLTGHSFELVALANLAAEKGSFNLTGYDASLSIIANFPLAAEKGSFALTGQEAGISVSLPLLAEAMGITLDGRTATIGFSQPLGAGKGGYILDGRATSFPAAFVFAGEVGSFELSGTTVNFGLNSSYALSAEKGAFSLDGFAIPFGAARVFPAGKGGYEISGKDGYIYSVLRMALDSGDLGLSGNPLSIYAEASFLASTGHLFISGKESLILKEGLAPAIDRHQHYARPQHGSIEA